MGQVSLRGIRKSYGAVDVIKGIDLDVRDGEFLVFVVPAGQGITARVGLAERLGDSSILQLHIQGVAELLTAEVGAERARIDAGQGVGLTADRSWVLGFDSNGRFVQ